MEDHNKGERIRTLVEEDLWTREVIEVVTGEITDMKEEIAEMVIEKIGAKTEADSRATTVARRATAAPTAQSHVRRAGAAAAMKETIIEEVMEVVSAKKKNIRAVDPTENGNIAIEFKIINNNTP
jgi:hypothetical protein